jgi:micrococcal nuclease
MYTYKAKITNVVDGDTVDAEIDLGFGIKMNERIRLYGIDTPEIRTRDLDEKARGIDAKNFLKKTLQSYNNNIVIKTHFNKRGKFGRILAELYSPDMTSNINQLLVNEGHVKQYFDN